jgi:ASC-1-like (ASCH) protein
MVGKTFARSELGIGEGYFEAVKAGRRLLSVRVLQCVPQLRRGVTYKSCEVVKR